MKCAYCGNDVPSGCQNCPSCGAAAPQPQVQQVPPANGGAAPAGYTRKNRTVYILLGFFLGTLGIHNFYAGYNGRGIGQLLITIFLGWTVIGWLAVAIWAVIEICTVDRDSNGVKFC